MELRRQVNPAQLLAKAHQRVLFLGVPLIDEDQDQQPQRNIERNNPLRRLIQDIISIVDQVSVVRSGILKRQVINGKPIMPIQIAGSKGKHLLSHSDIKRFLCPKDVKS